MRRILILVTLVAGCSFGMKAVDPKWDGTEEPACTDDPMPIVGDALIGTVLLGVGGAGADSQNDAAALGGFIGALVFTIAAAVGEGIYHSCKEAKAEWRVGGAIGRASQANRPATITSDQDDSDRRELERFRREKQRRERARQLAAEAAAKGW